MQYDLPRQGYVYAESILEVLGKNHQVVAYNF
jgi:hypothetical protein